VGNTHCFFGARHGRGDVRRPDNPLTRDVEWVAEINRILNDYIPVRTGVVLDQLRADGLVPNVGAPTFGKAGGTVAAGYKLSLANPGGVGAIYYTLDGKDPRLPTGAGDTARTMSALQGSLASRRSGPRSLPSSPTSSGEQDGRHAPSRDLAGTARGPGSLAAPAPARICSPER